MRKIEISVYLYEELNEKAKQQAIEHFVPWDDWEEPIFEDFIRECEKYGINIEKQDIAYSGFCGQGDGASFVCDDFNIERLINTLGIEIKHGLKRLFCDYVSPHITRQYYQYCHEQTVCASVDTDCCHVKGQHIIDYLENKAGELEEKLEERKNILCYRLYNALEDEYYNIYNKENIEEYYKDNEIEFYADGTPA